MHFAGIDLQNAFTYIEVPDWMRFYQVGPPIPLRYCPAHVRKQFPHLGRNTLIYPCYNRLAMGSTLAADILLAITIFKRYHSNSLQERLPGDLATFLPETLYALF